MTTLERLQARLDSAKSPSASEIRIWRLGEQYLAADSLGPIWEPQPTVEAALLSLLAREPAAAK